MGARDFGAGGFDHAVGGKGGGAGKGFVEGEADGLDGDVGVGGAFQEGSAIFSGHNFGEEEQEAGGKRC